ncbi:TetR/AcrR family transcriptional regulator [Ulvibacterium sp.]|uniref:TetR/AcrR family transcriptional regulator n=1 Tax=Ulvibacterium sp. TaxID=2665914 RepID=UPI003BABE4B8
MSPRTEKQLDAHRALKRKQIIMGALQLFATSGYFNTSISDIAKEVKMSKGLLYSYFENKEQLLNAVVDFALKEATELGLAEGHLKDLGPKEVIREVIEGFFRVLKEKKELWSLIVSLALHVGSIPSVHKTISNVYTDLAQQLEELFIGIGYENPENEAFKLGALMDGIGIQYMIFGESYPLNKIKENIINDYMNPKK